MAVIIEDGTAKADATSFATRAELIAYAAARGITILDVDASDVHLVNAMDYLATRAFKGVPVSEEQGTPYPRTVYLSEDSDDLAYPNDTVPQNLKKAQILLAVASAQGVKLLDVQSAGRRLKSRGLGPLKREYEGESSEYATVPGVDALLSPYEAGSQGIRLTTARA